MAEGLHHLHERKRIHQKHESYPHPEKFKRVMDNVVYAAGVLGPAMAIPQILKIWVEKNATGVSILSWSAFGILAIPWLIYGILHKEKPIILMYILWIIIDTLIVAGALIYG